MFRVLNYIKSTNDRSEISYKLHVTRNGSEHFRAINKEDIELGMWIPNYHVAMYQRLLPSVAELDEIIYKNIQKAYDEITELIHYRQTLIDHLANEDLHEHESTRNFLINICDEENDYFNPINDCYKLLTGSEMKKFKLR